MVEAWQDAQNKSSFNCLKSILFWDTICLNILHYSSLNVCSGSIITKFMLVAKFINM